MNNLTIHQIRRLNLELLIQERGLPKKDFAEEVDANPAYISQILSKNSKRNVGDMFARKIERLCKKDTGWMDMIHPDKKYLTESSIIHEDELFLPSQINNNKLGIYRIPLLSIHEAGTWKSSIAVHQPSNEDIMVVNKPSSNVFAVQVHGESMSPEFHQGETILIDPDFNVNHDYFVLALVNEDVVLRKLIREAGRWLLVAQDSRHPIEAIELNNIIGVVVEKIVRKFYV